MILGRGGARIWTITCWLQNPLCFYHGKSKLWARSFGSMLDVLFTWCTQRFQLLFQQGIVRSSRPSDFSHIPETGTAWSIWSGLLSSWVILPFYTCLILLPPHFQIICSFHAQERHKNIIIAMSECYFFKEMWRDIHWTPTTCQILSLCIYYFTASSTMLQCRHESV